MRQGDTCLGSIPSQAQFLFFFSIFFLLPMDMFAESFEILNNIRILPQESVVFLGLGCIECTDLVITYPSL